MTLQAKYNKLENDCFNPLTVDPNPPHDSNHFSLILGLENTVHTSESFWKTLKTERAYLQKIYETREIAKAIRAGLLPARQCYAFPIQERGRQPH